MGSGQSIPGPQGTQGLRGDTGPLGPKGEDGPKGTDGSQGPKGDTGPLGPKGADGPPGPIGPTGQLGPQGPSGLSVKKAIVNDNGELSFIMSDESIIGPFPVVANSANAKLISGYLGNNASFSSSVATTLSKNDDLITAIGGKVDNTVVANTLLANTVFKNSLGGIIAANPTLGPSVAAGIASNQSLVNKLQDALSSPTGSFIDSLANILSSVKYRDNLKGEAGTVSDPQSFLGTQGVRVDTAKQNAYKGSLFCYTTNGNIICNTPNNLNFTNNWMDTMHSDNNVSEISNDTTVFKKLMLVGNKSGGGKRKVGIWDDLDVAGNLSASGRDILAELDNMPKINKYNGNNGSVHGGEYCRGAYESKTGGDKNQVCIGAWKQGVGSIGCDIKPASTGAPGAITSTICLDIV